MAEPVAEAHEEKKSLMDRYGISLPIALTAMATTFAGLSTSEMSRAMYWRSAAAQDQSKCNDQWTLAGFKRDRAMIADTTATQLRALADYREIATSAESRELSADQPARSRSWDRWERRLEPAPVANEEMRTVLDAIRDNKPEEELIASARRVNGAELERTIAGIMIENDLLDKDWAPQVDLAASYAKSAIDAANKADDAHHSAAVRNAHLAMASRYDTDTKRYLSEAVLNRAIGYIYEVRVNSSTAASDRHRVRSDNFFYAMLVAQIGATLASLGMARKHRSAFWFFATLAGSVAIGFGVYVYLGM